MTRQGTVRRVGVLVMAIAALEALVAAGEDAQAPERAAYARLVARLQTECAGRSEAADKADTMTVAGKDGWLFLASELRHVSVGKFWGKEAAGVTRADKPEWGDPLPAILDFKEQLDKAGIQLIVVPVPPKVVVYPDMLGDAVAAGPKPPRLDPHHQEFYRLLREKGIGVLDLTDGLAKARQNGKGDQREYCKTDTHWSPSACELAARQIKERIKDAKWLPSPKPPFSTETRTIEITGDLEKAIHGEGGAKEALPARVVTPSGSDPRVTDTVDTSSPVLLLGDSHCLVFHAGGDMLATGAGLADQLAFELCLSVDLLGVRGSGATPARMNLLRRVRADGKYLSRKKLVVWCFSAREFTESQGWRKVPIVR